MSFDACVGSRVGTQHLVAAEAGLVLTEVVSTLLHGGSGLKEEEHCNEVRLDTYVISLTGHVWDIGSKWGEHAHVVIPHFAVVGFKVVSMLHK